MGKSGTGLGLAIVWNTVHDHAGTVTVRSDGIGTIFTLYFKSSQEQIKSDSLEERAEDLPDMGKRSFVGR